MRSRIRRSELFVPASFLSDTDTGQEALPPFWWREGLFPVLYRNQVDLGCLHAAVAPDAQKGSWCMWALGFAAFFLLAVNAKSQFLGVWMQRA